MSVIATASKELKFHRWPEGVLLQTYLPRNHEGYIQSISWSKDGSWVVLVPESGAAEIISIKDNIKLLQTVEEVYRPTCATFYTTTKKLIGIGTASGQIMVYDIKGKNIKKRFPRVSSKICSLHYNARDTHIAAICNNGEILILSNLTNIISTVYKVSYSGTTTSANFHRTKRNLLAAGSNIGLLATWDIQTNHLLCNVQAHQSAVNSVAFSPLRSDLVVSGGADRKFSFYDLSLKKHVVQVEVSSAVTSLDFSHCGVYLGIGYQNGNVALYDTRKLNNPLSVFEAHDGFGARHLLFQKVIPNAVQDNSVFNITIEEMPPKQVGDTIVSSEEMFDPLGVVGCDETNCYTRCTQEKTSQEYGDSFMIAMGLEGSNSAEATRNGNSAAFKNENKNATDLSVLYQQLRNDRHSDLPPNNLNFLPDANVLPTQNSMKVSSTPKYLDIDLPDTNESPIYTTNQTFFPHNQIQDTNQLNHSNVTPEKLKSMIREIVQEEIKEQTETIKATIKNEFNDMLSQVRRYFLDLQMTVIKEFVTMESTLEKRNSVIPEYVCADLFLSRNNVLKHDLVSLKQGNSEREERHARKC